MPCAWQGESETREANIADMGLGGCFIESNVLPAIGEEIELSVVLDGPESLMGPTVHVVRGFGFAMRFAHVDPGSLGRLEAWLARKRFSAG